MCRNIEGGVFRASLYGAHFLFQKGVAMSFFDKLTKLFATTSENKSQSEQAQRSCVSSSEIDDLQKIPASEGYKNKVYKKYYALYPEIPFISMDREVNTNWIEQAELFPKKSIVHIDKMTRFSDGLLPGHIYLLYWIGKNGQKKVPSYFEYKYGIDFEKEKQFLVDNGYLENDKPTSKGTDAIVAHFDVVEAHSPEATSAKNAQRKYANEESISIAQSNVTSNFQLSTVHTINDRDLMIVSPCDRERIIKDLSLINNLLSEAQKTLKIREAIAIHTDEIVFNDTFTGKLYTYFQYSPFTHTGKPSKYPFELYITSREHYNSTPNYDCFGNIGYLQNNTVGAVTLNIWFKNKGYHIQLGLIDGLLSVKKIDTMLNENKTTIYKK